MKIKCNLTYIFLICVFIFTTAVQAQAAVPGSPLLEEAIKREHTGEILQWLDSSLLSAKTPEAKKNIYELRGFLQEQTGIYDKAAVSYAAAANLESGENADTLKLSAAFCALGAGDTETATVFINSALLTAASQETLARARLYAVWADLCNPGSEKRFTEITTNLQTFLSSPLMKSEKTSVLFTLWWLTGDAKFATQLQTEFPTSPETAVTNGKSQLLPAPFCYFVPRIGAARAASSL